MISWTKPVGPDYSLWQPIYLVNHDKTIWQGERGCKFGKGTIQVNINHCRVHFTFPKYIDQVITTCKRFDHLSCSLKKAQLVSKISGKANKSTLTTYIFRQPIFQAIKIYGQFFNKYNYFFLCQHQKFQTTTYIKYFNIVLKYSTATPS